MSLSATLKALSIYLMHYREPLCHFLGNPIPDVPFPDGNKAGAQFEQNFEDATKDMMQSAFRNMGISILTLASLGGAAWYASRRV